MDLRTRSKHLMQSFTVANNASPTTIHLTPSDEIEILALSQDELGKEAFKIVNTLGPKHLERLFGLRPVFDAAATYVD
ncbi:MAG TPA: hypothetical protein VGL61_12960 [Kofleriaceae bacterium]